MTTPTRKGAVNCMDDRPEWNVAHWIVGNILEGGLAGCGAVLSAKDHPSLHADRGGPDGEGVCRCAPGDQWPRCEGCASAYQASQDRKAARS